MSIITLHPNLTLRYSELFTATGELFWDATKKNLVHAITDEDGEEAFELLNLPVSVINTRSLDPEKDVVIKSYSEFSDLGQSIRDTGVLTGTAWSGLGQHQARILIGTLVLPETKTKEQTC